MLIILAGLGGYLYMVEFPARQQEVKQETEQKKLLLVPETAITGLIISTAQGPIQLNRAQSGIWKITAPLQADADIREVQGLLRALVTGTVSRTVAEKSEALAPFGLDQPVTTVTVTAGAQQETIAIGDSGPLSNTLYVLRGSDGKVLLTDLAPRDFVNKSLLAFRRKELFQFVQNDVDRVRLTYPTTEIVIYNMAKDKPKPSWKIRYPIEAEADQSADLELLFDQVLGPLRVEVTRRPLADRRPAAVPTRDCRRCFALSFRFRTFPARHNSNSSATNSKRRNMTSTSAVSAA